MEKAGFSAKPLLISLFIAVLIAAGVFSRELFHRTTTVVFCDVGQGDGAYIRTADKIDILIDAGPSKNILTCLGKYMPFWDRTIELAFLSHPQKDHYGGYLDVLDRYRVKEFIMPPVGSKAHSFSELQRKLIRSHSTIRFVYAGDRVKAKGAELVFFWPEKQFIEEKSRSVRKGNENTFALLREPIIDPNDFSQVFVFSENKTRIVFTGDASPFVLQVVSKGLTEQSLVPIALLKVPHHGSKNGLTFDFLQLADPSLSVISAGKNNPYGHPSAHVLSSFQALKKKGLGYFRGVFL